MQAEFSVRGRLGSRLCWPKCDLVGLNNGLLVKTFRTCFTRPYARPVTPLNLVHFLPYNFSITVFFQWSLSNWKILSWLSCMLHFYGNAYVYISPQPWFVSYVLRRFQSLRNTRPTKLWGERSRLMFLFLLHRENMAEIRANSIFIKLLTILVLPCVWQRPCNFTSVAVYHLCF